MGQKLLNCSKQKNYRRKPRKNQTKRRNKRETIMNHLTKMIKLAVTLWMVTTTHAVTNPLAHRLHRAETFGHRRRLANSGSTRRRLPNYGEGDSVWFKHSHDDWRRGTIIQTPGNGLTTYEITADKPAGSRYSTGNCYRDTSRLRLIRRRRKNPTVHVGK